MTHFIMTATHGSFRAVIYLGCVDTLAGLTAWLTARGYEVETHVGVPDSYPRTSQEAESAEALTRLYELALACPPGA